MNRTLIFRKIGGIISEITEQYQYLSADPENMNPLELELFIANSHFLSEHLAILKKLDNVTEPVRNNQPNSADQVPPVSTSAPGLTTRSDDHIDSIALEPSVFNQVDEIRGVLAGTKEEMWFEPLSESQASFSSVGIDEEIPQIAAKSEASANVSNIVEAPAPELQESSFFEIKPTNQSEVAEEAKFVKEEPLAELIREAEPVKLTESLKPSEPKAEEAAKEVFPAKESLDHHITDSNSSTAERVPTLNEILSAGKVKENVVLNLNTREDRELKSMIKLNDKLMFIRDLFSGYSLAYSEAIEFVNRFDNFEAADNFLKQNYADKNKWSEKQASVDQFYEILNRRFS
ncbi:MAG TPA: hypothetical protein VLZ28_05240 [Daejeonella sp.]|nr:hypothetical protein [Daejeonella sp.]